MRIRVDENGKIDWIGTVESEQYREEGDGEYELKDTVRKTHLIYSSYLLLGLANEGKYFFSAV